MTAGDIGWRRVAATLRNRITAGDLKPGHRIPTEDQLGDEFGVCRTTVRRATLELQHEGLIVARRSFGTFVAEPARDLVLASGDWATSAGAMTVRRADGSVETRPAGTRITA
jgi:DNA-binding GntR family transcriptional regulator